jgi:hypothetical protein
MKISNLTVVSLAYGVILLVLSGWWLFNIDRTPVNRYLAILWLPLLVLLFMSISRSTSDQGRESASLKINLLVLGWFVALVIFRTYWDLDFILHGKEYSSTVQTVKVNEVVFSDEDGVSFNLPQQYSYLARFEEIYVTHDKDDETTLVVYPDTAEDLDGLMNAYVYVVGKEAVSIPEKCLSGRPVNPHYENWYYCVVSLNQVK